MLAAPATVGRYARALFAGVLLVFSAMAQPLWGQEEAGLSREQVLEALRHPDPDVRSGAYIALGDVGMRGDLPLLYSALYDDDRLVRRLAENAIWKIWERSGNALHDRMLQRGIEQMHAGQYEGAIRSLTALIRLAPGFTEAWNKRATLYYLVGEDARSIADCAEVLAREPNHFGALSGYGLLMLRRGDYRRALEYFEKALTVNPNLRGVPENIDAIKRVLEEGGGAI